MTAQPFLRVGVLLPEGLARGLLLSYLSDTAGYLPYAVSPDPRDPDQAVPELLLASGDLLEPAVEGWPGVPVLALLDGSDPRMIAGALRGGAAGVITSVCSVDDVVEAVRVVAGGQTWLPPSQVSVVLAVLSESNDDTERAAVLSLTARERQVLTLLGQGLNRQQIAERLFVSRHTVRTHVQNVLHKLGVHSQVAVGAAARRAVRAGWIPPEPE